MFQNVEKELAMNPQLVIAVISSAIKGTPWWVWLLFAFLLKRGIKAMRTRVVQLWTIFLMPVVFLGLAISGLITNKCTTCYSLSVWVMALCAGIIAAWFLNRTLQIKADKNKYLIQLPGSASTLVMILGIFAIKYFFGYLAAVNYELATTLPFIYAKLAIYGLISGLTIGKMLRYLDDYRKAVSTDLLLS
jgi:hypothetical protein